MEWTNGLQDYMNSISTLIDCFMIIGFTNKDLKNYYDFGEILEPKILSQFPPVSSCKISIPETIPTVFFHIVLFPERSGNRERRRSPQ